MSPAVDWDTALDALEERVRHVDAWLSGFAPAPDEDHLELPDEPMPERLRVRALTVVDRFHRAEGQMRHLLGSEAHPPRYG